MAKVENSNNLSEEGKRGWDQTKSENMYALQIKGNLRDELNVPFTLEDFKRALTGMIAPQNDEICYTMIKYLCVKGLRNILFLYNKVWEEGRLPKSWKEAVIVPIRKLWKDASKEITDKLH